MNVTGSDDLFGYLEKVAAAADDEWLGLPPAAYNSQELFELEAEHLFADGWVLIGRADQVASPGDYLCADVLDEKLVMVRDADNVLRVLSRVCVHRWMDVCEGEREGNCKVFVCPYHAWAYGLDGRLRGAPEMTNSPHFAVENFRLPEVRHEVWHGFVFVNIGGRAEPLSSRLAHIEDAIKEYGLKDWVVVRSTDFGEQPWDWKIMMDNGDVFHHIALHRNTVEPRSPGRLQIVEETVNGVGLQYGPAAKDILFEASDGGMVMPAYLPRVEGYEPWLKLTDLQRTSAVYLYVFPNYVISMNPDRAAFMEVMPLGPGRIHIRYTIMIPRDAQDIPGIDEAIDNAVKRMRVVQDEDFVACTAIQQSTKSRFAPPPFLSHMEAHQRDFARWVAQGVTRGRRKARAR